MKVWSKDTIKEERKGLTRLYKTQTSSGEQIQESLQESLDEKRTIGSAVGVTVTEKGAFERGAAKTAFQEDMTAAFKPLVDKMMPTLGKLPVIGPMLKKAWGWLSGETGVARRGTRAPGAGAPGERPSFGGILEQLKAISVDVATIRDMLAQRAAPPAIAGGTPAASTEAALDQLARDRFGVGTDQLNDTLNRTADERLATEQEALAETGRRLQYERAATESAERAIAHRVAVEEEATNRIVRATEQRTRAETSATRASEQRAAVDAGVAEQLAMSAEERAAADKDFVQYLREGSEAHHFGFGGLQFAEASSGKALDYEDAASRAANELLVKSDAFEVDLSTARRGVPTPETALDGAVGRPLPEGARPGRAMDYRDAMAVPGGPLAFEHAMVEADIHRMEQARLREAGRASLGHGMDYGRAGTDAGIDMTARLYRSYPGHVVPAPDAYAGRGMAYGTAGSDAAMVSRLVESVETRESMARGDRSSLVQLSRALDYERRASEAAEASGILIEPGAGGEIAPVSMDYTDQTRGLVQPRMISRVGLDETVERERAGEHVAVGSTLPSMDSIADYLAEEQAAKLDTMIVELRQIRENTSQTGSPSVIGARGGGLMSESRPGVK